MYMWANPSRTSTRSHRKLTRPRPEKIMIPEALWWRLGYLAVILSNACRSRTFCSIDAAIVGYRLMQVSISLVLFTLNIKFLPSLLLEWRTLETKLGQHVFFLVRVITHLVVKPRSCWVSKEWKEFSSLYCNRCSIVILIFETGIRL